MAMRGVRTLFLINVKKFDNFSDDLKKKIGTNVINYFFLSLIIGLFLLLFFFKFQVFYHFNNMKKKELLSLNLKLFI